MKKGLILAVLLLVARIAFTQQAEHVILITIDGFRPDFYLDPEWHTPHLREMMKDGFHANGVNSVFPSMTYPSHTTIVTGVKPAKHGIYFNNMFEPNGPTGKMYWNDSSIKSPTLWKAAKEKGLKTAALFWPVSADAPVMYNIPDIGGMGEAVREQYARPAGFVDEIRKQLFHDSARIEYGKDHNVANIASYIIKKDRPNLMAIHFFSVDHYQHEQGRQGPLVKEAVADADSSVGIIIDALKAAGIWEKTVLIVTGDHGFMDVKTSVNPNVWLVKAGLITDVKKDQWKAQFYSVGGSSYLYLKDKNDQKTVQQVIELLNDLPAEERKFFTIVDSQMMQASESNPDVAFALTGEHGASFGNAMSGEAVKPGHGGSHGYFPNFREIRTGFVAVGPGIKKGGMIKEMNLTNIAPAVAKILNLSLPTAKQRVPDNLFSK